MSPAGWVRYLFVVSPRRQDLYNYLVHAFAGDDEVHVLLDRRRGERRQTGRLYVPERRHGERRQDRIGTLRRDRGRSSGRSMTFPCSSKGWWLISTPSRRSVRTLTP